MMSTISGGPRASLGTLGKEARRYYCRTVTAGVMPGGVVLAPAGLPF